MKYLKNLWLKFTNKHKVVELEKQNDEFATAIATLESLVAYLILVNYSETKQFYISGEDFKHMCYLYRLDYDFDENGGFVKICQ